ncbi:hypothetical protein SAMN05428959_103214 [Duganella sp. CF517]|uniref:hypothetical protein n=1 Tax=Duganella sp. CF517 TaxID=1881038 RepID=UPI0008BF04CC|nr:hypothetical protein [Duganella sp. CF517]SEN80603.1 hypothetical protein SAMN05428959_103214 [Duganella sp. CF517]
MPTHPAAEWRGYVTIFAGASALVTCAIGALNYHVDPYLTHQWDTPQVRELRPGREKLSAWGKTYALARFRPGIVYVGNSRTELGLPTGTALFAGKDVFNGGLSGASLGDAIAMVRHAGAVSRLRTIIWGIDAPSFSMETGNTDFDRDLVARDRSYLLRRGLINVKRALTTDMTMDSIRLLRGTFGRSCHSSLAFYGQRDDACVRDRIDGWGGTSKAIVPRLQEYIQGTGPTAEAMSGLDESLAALCNAGSKVRLYINPTHAMTSDALYRAGKWTAMEAWQQRLAGLVQRHRAAGCDARIFDFSGFNSITTEPVPQASGASDMLYYWETSHYRVNVGAMILERMFGHGDGVPADFGIELTPRAVAGHLAAQRAARDRYHLEHPHESRMVLDVVAEAARARLTAR